MILRQLAGSLGSALTEIPTMSLVAFSNLFLGSYADGTRESLNTIFSGIGNGKKKNHKNYLTWRYKKGCATSSEIREYALTVVEPEQGRQAALSELIQMLMLKHSAKDLVTRDECAEYFEFHLSRGEKIAPEQIDGFYKAYFREEETV